MDEIYCPPFALTFGLAQIDFGVPNLHSQSANEYQSRLCFEGITFGCKLSSWLRFFKSFQSDKAPEGNVTNESQQPAVPTTEGTRITLANSSLYYQPTII